MPTITASTEFSVLSYVDFAKFRPFSIFNSYYVHYSTWLGAIWPMGVVTLLVIYGGSAVISYLNNPFTEDTVNTAARFVLGNFIYTLPQVGVVIFPPGANGTGAAQPVLSEQYIRTEWRICDADRATYVEAGRALDGQAITSTNDYTNFVKPILANFSARSATFENCTRIATDRSPSCRNGIGWCPRLYDGSTYIGVDNTLNPVSLQGSDASSRVRYLKGEVILCVGSGPNNTQSYKVLESERRANDTCTNIKNNLNVTIGLDCTRTVVCVNTSELFRTFTQATLVVPVGFENFPIRLLETNEELSRLRFNSSYQFPLDPTTVTYTRILMRAQTSVVLAPYFQSDTYYNYLSPAGADVAYGSPGDDSVIAETRFLLAPLERTTRFLPVTAFAMVAKFGQVIAAIAVANLFIRYINFLWFYSIATEDYFVADIDTRKFLLSNRKAKVKDFENQLMFALTFGSIDRFGVQTRQLFEFFKDRGKRYDRKETQLIVEDIQKHRTASRIGAFVKEEEKIGVGERNVEADYDLKRVSEVGGGRISRVTAAMTGKKLDFLEDEDVDAKGNMDAVIREVETTLKLAVIQDELNKMKVLAAMLFPEEAKKDRLAEKLNGVAKS